MDDGRLPSWQDASLGTMKRAALWLIAEVGEGQVFTKTALREAFPDTAQIDRRMRDLRDFGWQIDTNREDQHLGAHEQRFVRAGAPVWEPGAAATRQRSAGISAAQRREVLLRDGYTCRSCGIAAGAQFDDSYETAQLDVARRTVRQPGGAETVELVAECNRCRVGGRWLVADLSRLLEDIRGLSAFERRVLAGWVAEDRRELSALEKLWGDYRSLPGASRDAVREALSGDEP